MLVPVIGSSVSIAVLNVLNAFGAAIMLAITSPRLAGLAAIGIPAVIIPIALFGKRVREQSRASHDRLADASARASATLNATHTVQSYARERPDSESFAEDRKSAVAGKSAAVRLDPGGRQIPKK